MHDGQSFMVDFRLTVSTSAPGAASSGSSGPGICYVRPYEPRQWAESWIVRVKTSGGRRIAPPTSSMGCWSISEDVPHRSR